MMKSTPTDLRAAWQPLREELAHIHAPAALDSPLLTAFRQQHPTPGWTARLASWLGQERGLWLPLGGACVAALAAVLWLRPMLLNDHQLAPGPLQPAPLAGNPGELVTAFFPVGDPQRIAAASHARMVRVSLPRSALVAYGLPMNPELADQPINADLLVADDGSTLALRFVHDTHHLM